jgi:multidrug efflux pump subunit AcrA (membrane-fusion protein)
MIAGAVLAVGLIAGLGAMSASRRAGAVPIAAGVVERRLIGRAVVVPTDGVAEVRARLDGRVVRVLVKEGETVKEGQLLAEIEADDLRAEVARREAEKRALAAAATGVAEGARVEEKRALEADLEAARQELSLAESRDRRERALRAANAGTELSAEEAARSLDMSRARVAGAEARLALAKSGGRAADVGAARARVVAADAAVDEAKTGLSHSNVVAPIAGVVLARRIDAGDTVSLAQVGPPIFEIADARHLEARLEIEDGDATALAEGLDVDLTTPGALAAADHPLEPLAKGKIARLGGRLERRTIGVEDARVRADGMVRAAWIELAASSSFAIGQRLEAIVHLSPRNVSAMAPRGAVHVRDGRAVVEVPWGPIACDMPVTLGLADGQNVEVEGVAPGTRVIVPGR